MLFRSTKAGHQPGQGINQGLSGKAVDPFLGKKEEGLAGASVPLGCAGAGWSGVRARCPGALTVCPLLCPQSPSTRTRTRCRRARAASPAAFLRCARSPSEGGAARWRPRPGHRPRTRGPRARLRGWGGARSSGAGGHAPSRRRCRCVTRSIPCPAPARASRASSIVPRASMPEVPPCQRSPSPQFIVSLPWSFHSCFFASKSFLSLHCLLLSQMFVDFSKLLSTLCHPPF